MKNKKRLKKKENFNLKKEYKKGFEYLKESRKFIYIIIGIFFLFVLLAYFIPTPKFLSDEIIKFLKEILSQTNGMSQFELIKFIIFNNVQSSFFGMLFGVLLGIFPILTAIVNGYLLGFVSLMSVNNGGILTLWRIFPHGIFELPAVFISLGLGLKLGLFIFKKNKKESFKNDLINSLRIFLLIVLPLLIIAGIIEGTLMIFVK